MQILFPITGIENVTSEKGRGYNNDSTDFAQDSMFHVVETDVCANAQFVVCDDMGNEWADHIAINGDTISFPDFDKMCTYKITYPNFQAFSKNNLCKWVTQRLFFVSLHHVCT